MTTITRIATGQRMSQAVIHGQTIYLAGQVGTPGTSVTAQTQEILDKIESLLEQAGSDKTRILSSTIWMASMDSPWMSIDAHGCSMDAHRGPRA